MFCFCRFQNRIPLSLCGSFAKSGIKRDTVPRLLFIFVLICICMKECQFSGQR